MNRLKRGLHTTEFVCRIFYVSSAIALCALFALMFADVAGRFLLNSPITGASEVSEYLLVAIAFLALGHAQLKGQHVYVEILTMRFPKKLRHGLKIFLLLLAAAFFSIMVMQTGVRAYKDWVENILLSRTIVHLPLWWISFIASFGCALLVIALLVQVAQIIVSFNESESKVSTQD